MAKNRAFFELAKEEKTKVGRIKNLPGGTNLVSVPDMEDVKTLSPLEPEGHVEDQKAAGSFEVFAESFLAVALRGEL